MYGLRLDRSCAQLGQELLCAPGPHLALLEVRQHTPRAITCTAGSPVACSRWQGRKVVEDVAKQPEGAAPVHTAAQPQAHLPAPLMSSHLSESSSRPEPTATSRPSTRAPSGKAAAGSSMKLRGRYSQREGVGGWGGVRGPRPQWIDIPAAVLGGQPRVHNGSHKEVHICPCTHSPI